MTFNGAETLRTHWRHSSIPESVEWIVVDNDSNDDSVQAAKELGAIVIESKTNVGFAKANNLGFKAARGQYVAFINPDVIVDWDSLPHLADVIQQHQALISPQLINLDGSAQPNGRGVPSITNKIMNRLRRKREHGSYRFFTPDGYSKYVTWLTGAVIMGSKNTLECLEGPWDERFFLYHEDADLCLRAWGRDIPIILVGSANWTHSWARETINFAWSPWKHELKSMIRFYCKYPSLFLGTGTPRSLRRHAHKWGSVPTSAFTPEGD